MSHIIHPPSNITHHTSHLLLCTSVCGSTRRTSDGSDCVANRRRGADDEDDDDNDGVKDGREARLFKLIAKNGVRGTRAELIVDVEGEERGRELRKRERRIVWSEGDDERWLTEKCVGFLMLPLTDNSSCMNRRSRMSRRSRSRSRSSSSSRGGNRRARDRFRFHFSDNKSTVYI